MGDDNVGSAGLSARAEDGGAERPAQQQNGMEEELTETHFRPREDLPGFAQFPLMHTLSGHTGAVPSARFSKDGARLASASADATTKIWDVETGALLHTLQHKQGCSDAAWSHDGRLLATASDDGIIRLWDSSNGKLKWRLKGHTHYVTSVCFSSSGTLLASSSFDETVRVWDVQNGREIRKIPAHSDPVVSVDFSAEQLKPVILTSSVDGICRLFVAHTGDCARSMIPEPHENPCPPVTSAKFTPNNRFALMATLSSKLQLWHPELTGRGSPGPGGAAYGVKKTYTGHLNGRFSLHPTFLVNVPTGKKYIAVGSEDHHVYVYDLNKRSVAGLLRGRASASHPGDGHCDVVLCVDYNPSEPMLASSGGPHDCTVKLWRYSGAESGGEQGTATPMQS